jgi:hypothetical protein
MRCRVLLALLLFLVPGAPSFAVKSGDLPLTIVRAEIKKRDRIVAWVVDTPIYNEDPYFEVAVRTTKVVIVAERDPQNRHETLPEDWKPGAVVKGHFDKQHLFLQRLNGIEVQFIITHRNKIAPEE